MIRHITVRACGPNTQLALLKPSVEGTFRFLWPRILVYVDSSNVSWHVRSNDTHKSQASSLQRRHSTGPVTQRYVLARAGFEPHAIFCIASTGFNEPVLSCWPYHAGTLMVVILQLRILIIHLAVHTHVCNLHSVRLTRCICSHKHNQIIRLSSRTRSATNILKITIM